MTKTAIKRQNDEIVVHDYKKIINSIYNLVENELSKKNVELIKKYDRVLVNESLADATRSKNLSTILSPSFIHKITFILQRLSSTFGIRNHESKETSTTPATIRGRIFAVALTGSLSSIEYGSGSVWSSYFA